jgi:hypothetical protein
VDNLVNGLSWKAAVDVATTTAQTLATDFAAGQSIDGVTLTTGMRVLVKNQASGSENGLYLVPASGAPSRTADGATGELTTNATVRVNQGTVNGDHAWTLTTTGTITVGTTSQTWVQTDSSGGSVTAGNGLTLSGSTLSVVPGNGIIADGTSTRIDPSIVVQKYSVDVGDGSSTTITVTHSLGIKSVIVALYNKSTGEVVDADVTYTSTSALTLTFATAPASAAYTCVVHG